MLSLKMNLNIFEPLDIKRQHMLNTRTIGNKIIQARKKMNISQAQLAERLFISYQAVGKWERGESMPDIITFNRLAEILGVDLNYFSASFLPDVGEGSTPEPLAKQTDELPTKQQKKKLSWDLSSGNWVDADFSGLKNLHEKFSGSNLKRCKFVGSDLSSLTLKSNNLERCDFSGSNIGNSKIQKSHLDNNLFKGASLKETEFFKNHIQGCDFSGSNFNNSHIKDSYFDGNLFKDTSLKDAEFSGSYINGCDLSSADFSGAQFQSGGFGNNKIADAVWNHSSFIGMQLENIVFEGLLEDCYFENCTFNWVKFQNVTLKDTFFKNNKFKRMRFTDCQADQITYEFLKSGKADLTGITILTQ